MIGDDPHILILEARFYPDIADELVKGATAVLEAAEATFDRIDVPGVFEIPAAIRMTSRAWTWSADAGAMTAMSP